jgi:ribosomal protein S18 acetylase RimI-like enzyme
MLNIEEVLTNEQIIQLVDLAKDIWEEYYTPIIGAKQVEYMLENFQSEKVVKEQITEGYNYYSILQDGKIGGYMATITNEEEKSIMLSKLYVAASSRKLGLGLEMLNFLEDKSKKQNLKILRLTVNKYNTNSINWYLKMGFINKESVVKDIGGGFVMDDYVLEKVLN